MVEGVVVVVSGGVIVGPVVVSIVTLVTVCEEGNWGVVN